MVPISTSPRSYAFSKYYFLYGDVLLSKMEQDQELTGFEPESEEVSDDEMIDSSEQEDPIEIESSQIKESEMTDLIEKNLSLALELCEKEWVALNSDPESTNP